MSELANPLTQTLAVGIIMELIDTVLKWPIIVQGAIGSGLFWLVLSLGQKLFYQLSGKLNTDKKAASEVALMFRAADDNDIRRESFFSCIYGAIHYLIKAFIIIVLSLLISPINHVISIVGYFISIYFLFRALSWVPHFDTFGSKDNAKEKYKEMIDEYEKKTANRVAKGI